MCHGGHLYLPEEPPACQDDGAHRPQWALWVLGLLAILQIAKALHRDGAGLLCWPQPALACSPGVFESGSDEALLRLSWAVEPTKGARVAGGALKCFRDGAPSANLVAPWGFPRVTG